MLKYLSWEGGNREKEKNAIPNDLHVIQYLFLFGWKALKKEELWTGSWENLVLVLVSKWRDWTWGSYSVFWSSNSLSLAPVFLKQTFAVGLSCSFHSTGMAVLNLPANNLLPVDPEIVLKCSSYLMPDVYYSALNVYLSQALSWHPEKDEREMPEGLTLFPWIPDTTFISTLLEREGCTCGKWLEQRTKCLVLCWSFMLYLY